MSMEPFERAQRHVEELRGLSLAEACQDNPLSPKIRNGQPIIPSPINQVLIQLTEQQEATIQLLALLDSRIATVMADPKDTPRLREVDTGGLLKGDRKSMEDVLPSSPLIRGLFLEVGQRIEHQRHINGLIKTLAERVEL